MKKQNGRGLGQRQHCPSPLWQERRHQQRRQRRTTPARGGQRSAAGRELDPTALFPPLWPERVGGATRTTMRTKTRCRGCHRILTGAGLARRGTSLRPWASMKETTTDAPDAGQEPTYQNQLLQCNAFRNADADLTLSGLDGGLARRPTWAPCGGRSPLARDTAVLLVYFSPCCAYLNYCKTITKSLVLLSN